jgi:hypothetical protein
LGDGVALEPFKRVHRYLDVLRAEQDLKADILKNERRDTLKSVPLTFDPDVSKVVVVSDPSKADSMAGGLLEEDRPPSDT